MAVVAEQHQPVGHRHQMSEPIGYGWSIVGTVEVGFDPISGELANSQRSQVMNNGKALVFRRERRFEPGRPMGQFARVYRVSQPDYGTMTGGRVTRYRLTASSPTIRRAAPTRSPRLALPACMPVSATPSSPVPTRRSSIVWTTMNFRAAGLAQIGGYDQGNGSAQCGKARSAETLTSSAGCPRWMASAATLRMG